MRYSGRVLPRNDDWSTRHSVQATAKRTAALVNALTTERRETERRETERPETDVIITVLHEHGEVGPIVVTDDDVAEMHAAAVLLREVFAADDVDVAAATLNRLLSENTGTVRLSSHGGNTPWHPHLDRDDNGPLGEWFLASSCMALTVLIWDRQHPPGGVCASPSCRNVYLTQGGGPVRRYCSRRCATRERVAAHRRARA
jgi:hypothetical protein